MATYQLTMRYGRGSFLAEGGELSYDSTPARSGITVGGVIDFTDRPDAESKMLQNNSTAGAQVQGDRTQAVIYGLWTT